jgi:natural product precursor
MKKLMSKFSENTLSRVQMKTIVGGACICSSGGPSTLGYPASGSCGNMDYNDAVDLASDLNGSGDGYTYTVYPGNCL